MPLGLFYCFMRLVTAFCNVRTKYSLTMRVPMDSGCCGALWYSG